jgi:rhamnulose-1-phosphate aldolase
MIEILKQNPDLEKKILQVAEIAQYLWQNGWAERNAGNISVNVDDLITEDVFGDLSGYPVFKLVTPYIELAGKYFFVTGTGKRMRDLARAPMKNAIIIRIADDGKTYTMISRFKSDTYEFRPTSELPTHLGIHQLIAQRGSKEKVIIHTHANELVALTHNPEFKSAGALNNLLWGMHPETMVFVPKGLGFVPYTLPGSEDIARETIKNLQHHDIVLWEKHGVFAIGESVLDTFDNIDIICKSAKIYFMCRGAGFIPEGLNEDQLNELKELVKKFASS